MSPRALAKTYLRYWVDADHGKALATNAPASIYRFINELRTSYPLSMIYEAMCIVAGQAAHERTRFMLLNYLVWNPSAVRHCDEVLASKKPPKTFDALLERAYAAELQIIRNKITDYLQQEIDQFE